MITPASFKIRFPEFTCNGVAQIQLFIDDAVVILNEAYWGAKYDMGLSYLTAHFLTLANRTADGNKGAVAQASSRTVDGTSVTYNVPTIESDGDSAYYASTAYGQRYVQLRSKLGVPAYAI